MQSVSIKTTKPLDPDKFFPWVQALVAQEGPNILRAKGILAFKDDPDRFVFQGVHMILDGDHQGPWKEGEARENCRVREVSLGDATTPPTVTAVDAAGETHVWRAKFVVDASGRDTLIANRLKIKRKNPDHNSAAIFGHFRNAKRDCGRQEGNIIIFWFDHGWFWFIPLKDGITSVGAFNDACVRGKTPEIIRVSEGQHEKRISRIADAIAGRGTIRVICVAGPSSSGKTTFLSRLTVQLLVNGIHPVGLSLDDYYVDREKTARDARGEYDYESLEAIEIARLILDEAARGVRFQEMAVLLRTPATYATHLSSAFDRAGIRAFFVDGVPRIDPAARGTGWGFRLLVFPGVVALWPLLAVRWMRS